MLKKRLFSAALAAALLFTLPACGKKDAPSQSAASGSVSSGSSSSASEIPDPPPEVPEQQPDLPYRNPLTGEGISTDISGDRPVAIMLNNLKKAQPQLGVSQADIIYEMPAEGGITRMMAVFQNLDGVGDLGSVRSARDYYVSLAYGMDAIFVHAGGSPQAYDAFKKWGYTHLDGVNGSFESGLFWRDQQRKKSMGLEHSMLTSGTKLQELLPTYTKRVRLTHKEGFAEPLHFLDKDAQAQGSPCTGVSVTFSKYKTGVFTYDANRGLYTVEEYSSPYVDGNNNQQVAVKNVLVLYTNVSDIKGDDKGRKSVRTTGQGEGVLICDGTVQDIKWSKKDHASPMTYTAKDGSPLLLGVGKSYVNIVGKSAQVTFEASAN